MDWHKLLEWFLIGFVGGLGYLVVGTLYRLVVKG